MSKNVEAGVEKQVAGSLKEAIGKITGDTEIEVEGAAQKKTGDAERGKAAEKSDKTNDLG